MASIIITVDLGFEERRDSDEESAEGRTPVSEKPKSTVTMTEATKT